MLCPQYKNLYIGLHNIMKGMYAEKLFVHFLKICILRYVYE